ELEVATLRAISLVGGAEESFMPFVVCDIGGCAVAGWPLQPGHDGADAGPAADVAKLVAAPAGMRVEVAVVVVHANEGADDGALDGCGTSMTIGAGAGRQSG